MTDMPRFQRLTGDFEHCYEHYHGGRLVGAVLRWVDRCQIIAGQRIRRTTDSVAPMVDSAQAESGQMRPAAPRILANSSSR